MNVSVQSHFFIIAQILGIISLIAVFCTFQTKNKIKLLLLDALANLLMAFSYFAMGSMVIAVVNLVSTFRGIVFAWLNNQQEKRKVNPLESVGILIFFQLLFFVSVMLTWETWLDLAVLGIVMVYVYALWAKGNHLVRVLCLVLSAFYVWINISQHNIMGIVVESVYIISIAIFYIRYLFKFCNKRRRS